MGRARAWLFLATAVFTVAAAVGLIAVSHFARDSIDRDIAWLTLPVSDFSLTNQDARVVSLADLRGRVWVADIIFTRCAGPCPVMTQKLGELQPELLKQDGVRFVTLTTDPEFDSPKVMRRFGERFGADLGRWLFLTGSKKEIARLAVDSLKLVAVEKAAGQRDTPEDLFIHSTRFVIVDKKGVMRATLESTDPQVKTKAERVVKKLLRE